MKIKIKKGFYFFTYDNGDRYSIEYYDGISNIVKMRYMDRKLTMFEYFGRFEYFARSLLESGEGFYLGE